MATTKISDLTAIVTPADTDELVIVDKDVVVTKKCTITVMKTAVRTFAAGENIILATSTGTKIGTATTQLLGFYNKTPVDQPAAVADATDAPSVILRLNDLLARMRELGLIAT